MENKKTSEDYAKNYGVIKSDGFYGPFSVGNISEYDDRDIINICVKTLKSGDRNAMISYPKSWGKASVYAPGDQVNLIVEQGFIKKISHAKPRTISFSAASVNREVTAAGEQAQAESAVDQILKEVAHAVPAEASTLSPF